LILPLGISFFTFQQITFLIQCFRDKKSDINFSGYVLYITFFPQLIAGPIVYLSEFKKSIEYSDWLKWDDKNITDGIFLFCIGLFKKLVLADTFSIFADTTFNSSVESLNSSTAWIGAISYYFQLYFDFSGYCDMAIGAALLFNIKLPLNFNSPYKALNIQDFWRRWHITLSRWLKDFIYIPLGGNRTKHWKTISNVLVVFLIGGIWHGANWTFIVWGLFHGIGIATFIFWEKLNIKIPRFLSYIITQVFILLLWVFFRSKDIDYSFSYLMKMFDFCEFYKLQGIFDHVCRSYLSLSSIELKFHDMNAAVIIYWSILTIMSFILITAGFNFSNLILNNKYYPQRYKAIFSAIIVFGCITLRPILRESPFIYFNF
jgi:D-alanyl-lipoteichoic acid acyltransferase DltB (MBOAT superfamily)